jgi:ketosteroid isomerase-like protein
MRNSLLLLAAMALVQACASLPRSANPASARQQVMDTERAFARTMADGNHAGFTSFLSEGASFFSGDTTALRGKAAVAAAWKPLFDAASASFSWEPDHVEVLESGTLALSTGPVHDPAGKVVGRFNSIWRREAPGRWRIVFDKGSPVCNCAPLAAP